jgi:hypothetical protein
MQRDRSACGAEVAVWRLCAVPLYTKQEHAENRQAVVLGALGNEERLCLSSALALAWPPLVAAC